MHRNSHISFIFSILISGFTCVLCGQEILTDFDGNEYPTVMIGDRIWMAENLRSIHDANGVKIKRVCYGLISENCEAYGGLYAWDELKVDEENDKLQGICPQGWHIPDDQEWADLINAIGGADSAAYKLNSGQVSGFQIQYGGNYHHRLRNFNYLEDIAYFWTATSFSSTAAFMRMIGRRNVNSNRSTIPKVYCLSVRCIKD